MPELPEVETVRRALEARIAGRRIASATPRRADLRIEFPQHLAARIVGRRITGVSRRAKYLLIGLDGKTDGGDVLVAHLGMSGRILLHRQAPPPGPHDHLILALEDGQTLYFNDARRFGLVALASAETVHRLPFLRGLGPEPLDEGFDRAALAAALAGRRTSIKAALLDQRVVAGLGNIYVCESLFRAGISPRRRAGALGPARIARLTAAIKDVLRDAIEAGGSTLRDHRQPTGDLGYFQHCFAVYDREGQACGACDCDARVTGGVRRVVQGGRSTFYCPRRQR
ncbi:MAG: bifunctional DNA-formamidopyrimidine glycosylase/DNA-(apurinic or apyrimidinic site) lyase [Alphaproteobacteria bacterium]